MELKSFAFSMKCPYSKRNIGLFIFSIKNNCT